MKPMKPMKPMQFSNAPRWWPEDLGQPNATGGQDQVQYAYPKDVHRLLLREEGRISIYDTGGYQIQGISQASDIAHARVLTDGGPIEISQLKQLERAAPISWRAARERK
jgi:hypothetical protein